MTASAPRRLPSSSKTGMPPPPEQTTSAPESTSVRMVVDLHDAQRLGRGDHAPEVVVVGGDRPVEFGGKPEGFLVAVDRADRLGRVLEGGVVSVDDHLGEDGDDVAPGQHVLELLLEHIADHALALGPEHVERVGRDVHVGGRLQREQPHLRPVAVRHDEVVVGGELGDCRDRLVRMRALGRCGRRLAAAQERVASERDDDLAPACLAGLE